MIIDENKVKNDLRLASRMINSKSSILMTGKYDKEKPYWAATQNLEYIGSLNKNKQVTNAFTILGSSDNVFELVRIGIPHIVATDINTFAPYIFYLKKAALKTLDLKEYVAFLMDSSSNYFFSSRIFQKVIKGFTEQEEAYQYFWSEMFSLRNGEQILESFVKPDFVITESKIRNKFIPYLQNKNFQELKAKITHAKIDIFNDDALECLKNIQQTFEWMDISNILLFVYQLQCHYSADEFSKYIKDLEQTLSSVLSPNGRFVIDYLFKVLNPQEFLESTSECNGMDLLEQINQIYSLILQTIDNYFEIDFRRMQGIRNSFDDFEEKMIPDQLVLARLKK